MKGTITGRTKVCGIFGHPVDHSLSPPMHNAAFAALGLDYIYVPFPVSPDSLPQAVTAVRALGLAGVNVTVPHKEAVLPLLDELSEAAALTGAVNTIVNRAGRLYGDNTDGRGFLRSLAEEAGFLPAGKTALIIGAGGAARAVAVQLALSGVKGLVLTNRTGRRANELAALLAERTGIEAAVALWPDSGRAVGAEADAGDGDKSTGPEDIFRPARQAVTFDEAVQRSDLIVQATSLGLSRAAGPPPLPNFLLGPEKVVCDLVYTPPDTAFLKLARKAGARTVSGLGMLLYQGVLAFELWTGAAAPVEVMREALLNFKNH